MKANKTLPLFPDPIEVVPVVERVPKQKDLWLCINFTQLALDVFPIKCIEDEAFAVVEEQKGGQRLVACNQTARDLGVYSGLALNAALALVPDLKVTQRNISKEQQTLNRLAAWANQFTSHVSVGEGHFLWLEIGRSLRLFGGAAPLRQLIKNAISDLNVSAKISIAPTPLAALWLSRAGHDVIIREYHELPGQLGKLPLSVVCWAKDIHQRLQRMGVDKLGEFIRLPRSGIARRFGKSCLEQLDQALGRIPDPKLNFQLQPRFEAELELPCEMTSQKLLAHGIERLVNELGGFLLARQGGVQNLTLKFHHLEAAETVVNLGLLGVSRNPKKLMDLLQERMENLVFPEPVIGLSLRSGKIRRLDPDNQPLFSQASTVNFSPELIDRLRARLGVDSVSGVCLVPEHRPERAWTLIEPGDRRQPQQGLNNRPLWLLQEPISLVIRRKTPYFEGMLSLTSSPERIETGWWDGSDICRDYYIAANPSGRRLWIYRDRRRRGQWFLHGIFG